MWHITSHCKRFRIIVISLHGKYALSVIAVSYWQWVPSKEVIYMSIHLMHGSCSRMSVSFVRHDWNQLSHRNNCCNSKSYIGLSTSLEKILTVHYFSSSSNRWTQLIAHADLLLLFGIVYFTEMRKFNCVMNDIRQKLTNGTQYKQPKYRFRMRFFLLPSWSMCFS